MEPIFEQAPKELEPVWSGEDCSPIEAGNESSGHLFPAALRPDSGKKWNDADAPWRAGEFYKCLSIEAMNEFEAVAAPFRCQGGTVLFTEEQEPTSILFLLQGRVKLSINSADGRRLILGIVGPGEILGITSAVSGCAYETTAEAQFPCCITSFQRQGFLDFLMR